MAKRRLLRFFVILFALFVIVGVLGAVTGGFLLMRGPYVPEHATLLLRIGGTLVETPPSDVFGQVTGGARAQTVRSYVDALRRAKTDARISSVLIMPTHFDLPYWAKVQELRDAILDFKQSGKRINAYLEDGGDREYYLATACDRIFLVPGSPLDVKGIASYAVFLRGTLDKIGATADFEQIAEYKTAVNQLTERAFTPAHREMDESLNRDMYEQLVRGIAEGRKKRVEDVRALIDDGPFLPDAAVRAGLVDALAYEDQLDDLGALSKDASVEGEDYLRGRFRARVGRATRIAVIYISGVITSGDSGFDPLNGEVAGSKALVEAIRAARGDPNVKAIVLRIDSPGGSSTASDVIWRELSITRDEKPGRPLVASMSDLAASGGYYVAIAAPQIVAQPATLTGSIGIFGGKVVTGGTYAKLGAHIESLSIGRNAEMDSPARPFTDSERQKLREELRTFYGQFVAKVAASRKMPVARVEELAHGRVWTGQQAKANGLVDALGGLDAAIALAKTRAGIAAGTEVEIVNYPARKTLFELLAERLSGPSNARDLPIDFQMAAAMVGAGDRQALGLLTAPMRLFRRGEPLALMPVRFFFAEFSTIFKNAKHRIFRLRDSASKICVRSSADLTNGFFQSGGVDVDFHPRAGFFHVGLIEACSARVQRVDAELVARGRVVGRRDVLPGIHFDDGGALRRRDGAADAAGRQRERHRVDLGALAHVGDHGVARERRGRDRLETRGLGGLLEIGRRFQLHRHLVGLFLRQIDGARLNQVVTHRALHLVQFRYVRLVLARHVEDHETGRRRHRLAHGVVGQRKRHHRRGRLRAQRVDHAPARKESRFLDLQAPSRRRLVERLRRGPFARQPVGQVADLRVGLVVLHLCLDLLVEHGVLQVARDRRLPVGHL